MGCSKVSNSEHGLLICTREDGHAPPCHWQRKLRGQKCPFCGDTCEWDVPKLNVQTVADTIRDFANGLIQGGTTLHLNSGVWVCRGCMCLVNPTYPPELQGHGVDCVRSKLLDLANRVTS